MTASSPLARVPDSTWTNFAIDLDAQWGKPGDEGLYVLGEFLARERRDGRKEQDSGHPGNRGV